MRIVLVAASLDILGGHGVQAQALMQGLRTDGYATSFVPVNPRFPGALRRLRRYPIVRTCLNQTLYLPSLVHLRNADVVHIFSASYWSFLLGPLPAILAARASRARVVLHYHSGEAEDHLAHWGPLVHPCLRLVDNIVVPSSYLRDVFARFGYKTHVIPNVVDTSRFRYRDRMPLRPRILSTRHFEPHYKVDTTLEAFHFVAAQHPQATLTLAGSGSQDGKLRHLARSLKLNAQFLGRVEPADMPALCDEADVFVNASVVDNQPVSILEAFAAGLHVVSTGTGAIPALVRDGQTGSIVPANDPGAMAKAILTLLDDPERAILMARRARQEVDRYTWPRVRDHWAAVYAGGAP